METHGRLLKTHEGREKWREAAAACMCLWSAVVAGEEKCVKVLLSRIPANRQCVCLCLGLQWLSVCACFSRPPKGWKFTEGDVL